MNLRRPAPLAGLQGDWAFYGVASAADRTWSTADMPDLQSRTMIGPVLRAHRSPGAARALMDDGFGRGRWRLYATAVPGGWSSGGMKVPTMARVSRTSLTRTGQSTPSGCW